MKTIVLFLAIIYSTTVFSQSVRDLDKKYGFKKFRFGMSLDSVKNDIEELPSYKNNSRGFVQCKVINPDLLNIGDAVKLSELNLIFFKNQLYHISIQTKGLNNSMALLTVYEKAYGKIDKDTQYWFGDKVTLDYRFSEDDTTATSSMSISISDLKAPPEPKKIEFNKDVIKKAAGDL
jgi:hypothetical protein